MPPVLMAQPNGPRIRELREGLEWTQERLARKIRRTRAAISKIESGKPASVTIMRQCARALRTDLAEITISAGTASEVEPLQRTG
jgi:transcriptional regulator with XRE-family HTH domain